MSYLVRYLLFLLLLHSVVGCDQGNQQPQSGTATQDNLVHLENRAVGLMGQFKYDEAAKLYKQLSKRKDLSAAQRKKYAVDLAIAWLNRRQGEDLSQAASQLDRALANDAADIRALYCRALLHFNAGETAKAEELFELVAKADSNDSYAPYYVGQCCFLQGEFQAALEQFLKAQQIDPYLRSAYYGAFQAAQRLKQRELAAEQLRDFQKLEQNPRARLAELKYTRMGPKAEVTATNATPGEAIAAPEGALFRKPIAALINNQPALAWTSKFDETLPPNITVADIDGDAQADVFISRAFGAADSPLKNAILLQREEGFEIDRDHPLASIALVNTALWGDYDNDGLTDVYLCRQGPNQLWKNEGNGTWRNVTDETKSSGGKFSTIDGACFDSDHDGDLDYLLCNLDGPTELLNNDRDGTFQGLAEELRIQGAGNTQQVLLADLDGDDDVDLVFLNRDARNEVFLNDRFWRYSAAEGFGEFAEMACLAAVAADVDVDGQVELFTLAKTGIYKWVPNDEGVWAQDRIVSPEVFEGVDASKLTMTDVDGDGLPEIIVSGNSGWIVLALDGRKLFQQLTEDSEELRLATGLLQQVDGPALLSLPAGNPPLLSKPGPGRYAYVLASFSGKTDKAAEMRSNASGIGVQGVARIDDLWSALHTFRADSGPGQSLQPQAIGLAGRKQIDFLRLLWPDGVSQTELNLRPGELHDLQETQRQAGSCPLVFVWDGQRYVFVADMLGAGGIGFNLGRAEYYPPRPTENLLLPSNVIQPQNQKYVVKLGEPMEEICYFDAIRLVAYDLPPEWHVTLDERFGAAEPLPTGSPWFYRDLSLPKKVINDRGQEITAKVLSVDRVAAPLQNRDRRFIGLTDQHSLTLTFDQPLDELASPVLLFDGWVEYAYSQTAFAAWQAGVQYVEPTIEACDRNGQWQVVSERFGYMAGTPRQATMPLNRDRLPEGTTKLRITTNMEIYWDRIAIIDAKSSCGAVKQELKLSGALIDDVGFSVRTIFDQRYPVYDYDHRPPLGDARHPAGFYTSFGDAKALVENTDDAVAIIGPGEELHLEFELPAMALPEGWSRAFVLEADGWCKDADLFTQDAGTVEPLPTRGELTAEQAEVRKRLHGKYNNRYRSGY